MTRHPSAPFAARLETARRMLSRRPSRPPVHLADQLAAAGRETRALHDRLVTVLPVLQPDRNWRQRLDSTPSDEVRTYLLAALLGCTTVCVHLRRGGPRPAVARLPLRRVDCDRCVQTITRPSTAEDECDVCGSRGVTSFHAFAVRLGPAMLAGDACRACAAVLGIAQEVAS